MDLDVYIEPSLLAGEKLSGAGYVKELDCWVLQSMPPKTQNIDEYEKTDQDSALKMYPELKELFELELDRNVFFRKGRNSERWYDFV